MKAPTSAVRITGSDKLADAATGFRRPSSRCFPFRKISCRARTRYLTRVNAGPTHRGIEGVKYTAGAADVGETIAPTRASARRSLGDRCGAVSPR